MSYRIVYNHAAIVYSAEILNASLPSGQVHFYEPQYLLFELGGDNNVWAKNYSTGRDYRPRSWCSLGFGMAWEVMQEVVRFSAACESGCLKFYGKGDIAPEYYIRHVRKVIASALPYDHTEARKFGLSARLELNRDTPSVSAVNALNAVLDVQSDDKGKQFWVLNLKDPAHAALLINYGGAVDKRRASWVLEVDAPCSP